VIKDDDDRSHSTNAALFVSRTSFASGGGQPSWGQFRVACTMTADLRDDPKYWRFHAKEILSVAKCLEHENSKIIMRRIADDYEYIAKLIERQRREREKK
jgi:hypothetical protein